ncbi:MAG: glycosyltransferase family 4 protein [Candidatus Doudnabacteria bacterium]
MRKNLFITTIFCPATGGIELCLHNIIKRLPKGKAVVLTSKRRELGRDFDRRQNYPIYRRGLETHFLKPKWLVSPFFALRIALKEKVEFVQAAHGFASYLAAWVLKKLLGLPYFVWAYGLDILAMQKSRFLRYLVKRIYKEAAGGIANSNFTREEMSRLGLPAEKISVIYPGVDGGCFRPGLATAEVRKKYHIPAEKKILLSVSRLVSRKGFDLVIRALPAILEKFPNTIYFIGGKGPDEARLRAMVEKSSDPKIQEAVKFIGFVQDADLPRLYNLADIFLMPSRQIEEDVEGFGMVFLEANACGCPVIGGRSGGIPEAIIDGETGFLVDPENPKDLAFKVIQLLGNENLSKKMGEAGRRRVLAEFNWEKIIKNFISTLYLL